MASLLRHSITLVGLAIIMGINLAGAPSKASAASSNAPAEEPNTAAIASPGILAPQYLAQGYYQTCPKAEPIRIYETQNFWVSICQGMDGSTFYHGVDKSNASRSINLFNVSASSPYDYTVVNGNTAYQISPQALTVVQNGSVIQQEAVLRVIR